MAGWVRDQCFGFLVRQRRDKESSFIPYQLPAAVVPNPQTFLVFFDLLEGGVLSASQDLDQLSSLA